MTPRARFDDLRPRSRRSFTLDGFRTALVATETSDVVRVLADAERQVAAGRWVAGFVTYEASPAFDPAFVVRSPIGSPVENLPLAWFGVFDRRIPSDDSGHDTAVLGRWVPAINEDAHAAGIDRIHRAIVAGDTYQVNHTFRMTSEFDGEPEALYLDLIAGQSCGYGAFIDTGDWTIVSASPELFFEWRHGKLISRPMKGTAPRGVDLDADEAQRAGLVHSEKQRAENLMIVDMVRNDMGRIARLGTVQVPALFTTEKYDTVWQMTSTVVSEPRPETTLPTVFGALFPCASITGAPKIATMGLIAELETSPRGAYCGAIGYGGPRAGGAEWAFNVGIRTVTIDRATGTAFYGTGGGVTYDSTAAGEYREALLKTRILDRRATSFSLLETMRWSPEDGYRNLTAHLGRLTRSAWYFDVPVDPAEVRSALDNAVRHADGPLRVRLLVGRSGRISTEIATAPHQSTRVELAIDDIGLDPGDPMLRHKTTERSVYDAAAARHPHADDVILITMDGLVADTSIATLCAELDGTWVTPPVADGALPGIARQSLIDHGRLEERSIPVEALFRATRLARVNSLRGWEEAVLVGSVEPTHPVGQPRRRLR
ncbi:MAG: aminodeoxychorismate synthase component I [Acidimicrobiia bacterium]